MIQNLSERQLELSMGEAKTKTSDSALPFLKWAGGKRWLTHQYADILPNDYKCYVEPFLGSGAVFFYLQPDKSVLSDRNADLMNTYRQMRLNWRGVQRVLRRHQNNHSKDYYYEERGRQHRVAHEKAAQFIYLNRTCWNGLYRVNLRGEFNVPIGTKSAVHLDTDDFATTARLLKSSKLIVSDFERTIDDARRDDFIFIDPPYITSHNLNGFIKYNDHLFSWADQERLSDDGEVLGWSRAQQAAFLIFSWQKLLAAIEKTDRPWAKKARTYALRQPKLFDPKDDLSNCHST